MAERWGRPLSMALLLFLAFESLPAARTPVRVLLLQSFDETPLTFGAIAEALRTELGRRMGETINFVQVSLQPTGFRTIPESSTVAYLRSTFFRKEQVDLIVTTGAPAALFVRRHRPELFRDTPAVHAIVDQRFLRGGPPLGNAVTIAVKNDIVGAVANVLQLLPETRHLFVVLGASPLGDTWREFIQPELRRFQPSLTMEWSTGMSFAEVLKRSATLGPHSAILYVFFNVDAHGAAQNEERVLARLHEVASAPIFGTQSTQLGHGIVGGPLMPIEDVSRRTVDVSYRILRGELPAHIRSVAVTPASPVFDWRELRRWGISETRLPARSVVRFREASQWERNRGVIVGAASIVVVEALLIVALVVSHIKRGRAQQSLSESEERFRQLASVAPVMIWTSGLDKGCADVNRPWLDFTGRTLEQELGGGWAECIHPDDWPASLDAYSRAFDRHDSFRIEYRLRRADGEYRWVLATGVPRYKPDGSFAGYIGSAIDVTEQKAAHEALSGLSGRLIEAQERERRRIARELHDDIGQRLALLTVELDQIDTGVTRNVPQAVRHLVTESTALARDIQSLSHRLHSSKLEYLGLASAAASFCKEASAQFAVQIICRDEGIREGLCPETALAIFRVLQEAITNALKHSAAGHISVVLRQSNRGVELEVSDSGVGFDVVDARRRGGLGLISMEERMKLIGGEVQVRSEEGGGTTVWACAPTASKHDLEVVPTVPDEVESRAADLVW
jgi:PAS domain S-box-containing protein